MILTLEFMRSLFSSTAMESEPRGLVGRFGKQESLARRRVGGKTERVQAGIT